MVVYTTKWYSSPILFTWLALPAVEGWFYGYSHHWHESAFVLFNLAVGQLFLVLANIFAWIVNHGGYGYSGRNIVLYLPRRNHG